MYRLVRSLGSGRKGAVLSAMLYAMAPWHVFQLFHFNRFPVAPVYALLPLLFLSVERMHRDRLGAMLLGSACLAGIALSHQGYAVFACIFFVLYTCLRALPPGGFTERSQKAVFLFHMAGAGLLGIGAAAFLLVPHILESHLLPFLPSLGKAQGARGFLMDNPYLLTLFGWRRQPIGHTGYLGISLFLFSLLGVVGLVKQRRKGWVALLTCYAFSYFLVLGHENLLYPFIPFVYSQFYAGRYIIFLVFFLCIAAGFAYPVLEDWFRKREASRTGPPLPGGPVSSQSLSRPERGGPGARLVGFVRPRLLPIVFAVFLLDMGPQIHYVQESPRHALPDQEKVYASIREKRRADPNRLTRALDIPKNFRKRNHGSLILPYESRCPTPEAGQFGTLSSYGYIFKMLKNLRETLPFEQGFSRRSREVFALLNVGYVFTDVFPASVAEKLGGENFGGSLWLFTFPETEPVLAAATLENIQHKWEAPASPLEFIQDRWTPPDAVDRLLAAMEMDDKTNSAKRILVRSGTDAPPPFPEPLGPVSVGPQELGTTTMRFSISAGSDCYLRISHSWFPHLQVLLDGKPVNKVYRSAMDFLVIPFPEGEHRVEVRAVLSPLRRFCLAVSALFSGVWFFLFFRWTFRTREGKP